MKVGTHAQESLADIIERKRREIDQAGFALWGYGGNTCHPRTMVQPFAEAFRDHQKPIYLCMNEMNSQHFAEQLVAAESSPDGVTWEEIPEAIQVRGSRFALKISSLEAVEFDLPLDRTKVAIGPSTGRIGSKYINGRVDKACLEVLENSEEVAQDDLLAIQINLIAKLEDPYALFLRKLRPSSNI